jgi:hypothetical protein
MKVRYLALPPRTTLAFRRDALLNRLGGIANSRAKLGAGEIEINRSPPVRVIVKALNSEAGAQYQAGF